MKYHPIIPLVLLSLIGILHASDDNWAVDANPYRVRLKLDHAVSQRSMLAIDPQIVLDEVAQVAVDQINHDTLAFERTVIVNPHTGKVVGRFQLVRIGRPLDVDGSFKGLRAGTSPWLGFAPSKMSFEPVTLEGKQHHALMIEEEKIANVRVLQEVDLEPGKRYLLDHWIMMEPIDNEMNVTISDPSLRLFSHAPHSYYNKMPPFGEWARRLMIFRPRPPAGASRPVLEITHAFIGRGGVAAMSLQEVAWRLIVDPDEPTDALDVYTIARAGHRLTHLTDELLIAVPPRNVVLAEVTSTETQLLNPNSVKVVSHGVSAWTIAPELPLKTGLIDRYAPAEDGGEDVAVVNVFEGGAASLVVAVDTGTARLDDLKASCDLPATVLFHRLATIPVYDGATVNSKHKGKLIETRYDAMVPVDYTLDPDSEDGKHVVVATITPNENTTPGVHRGRVTLDVSGRTLTLPVELRMSILQFKPMSHFSTIVGVDSFFLKPRKGVADMADDGTSMAEYHGLAIGSEAYRQKSRPIIERYYHTMLDNHLQVQSPAYGISRIHSYKVVELGPGLAPKLTDWVFYEAYANAIREFVIDPGVPWFMVGRSNGHLMDKFWLNNGRVYSVNANPDDPNWVQISREQFDQLVGDYWDAMGKHLDELGILDRAVFVIDESQESTYDDILAYVRAMRSRPYSSHIKIGHTIQKPSTWTRRLPNGELMMDELLDIPMPANDEHYNFFEPEWNARMTRPKIQWVYNTETDHINLENAGLSSTFLPLKLERLGVQGWYIWDVCVWSLPYAYFEGQWGSTKYRTGPVINPWVNPFYHHGPGVLSLFYPPDPRGPAPEPTDLVVPSYRLTLMRDGIQVRALLEAMRAGRDDMGRVFDVDASMMAQVEAAYAKLWPDNPVQWYLDYADYRTARQLLYDLAVECGFREGTD